MMKTPRFLQSGYAYHATLLLALLMTTISLLYFSHVNEAMLKQDTALQKQNVSAYQSLLNERIRMADHALMLIMRAPQTLAVPRMASPYFKSINLITASGKMTPLLGEQLNLPDQTEAIRIHLERDQPALITLPQKTGTARVFLLRGLLQDDNTLQVITAELAPEYLWHIKPINSNHLLAISRQGQLLYSSTPYPSLALTKALQQQDRSTSGHIQWKDGTDEGQASFITMDMHDQYATDDWSVVAFFPPVSLLTRAGAWDWILSAGVLFSILLAWTIVLRLRKIRLGSAIKHPDTDMHARLVEPLEIVRVMEEFDRAILSNASLNNILDLVFTNAPQAIPCTLVAITHIDEAESGQKNTLVSIQGRTQSLELPKLDKLLRQRLDTEPDGFLVEHPESTVCLKPFVALGSAKLYLFPVYRDSTLSTILYFGLSEKTLLTGDEHRYARAFADRLGVALTSVMRGKELYMQEHFDPVTGLPNRTSCRDRLSQEISRARRKQLLIAIIYINLIGFKKVNDSLGYVGGDNILTQVAQRFKTTLRESDIVSRFGNDEFVILLPDINSANEISKVAGKLLEIFAAPFSYERSNTHLNAAMGISLYPNDGQTIDHLLQHAEMAMTRIKSSGHTQYAFYEEHMNSKAVERLKLEHDLRQAINGDQLFLVYQPQIDLRTGEIAGVEALVRWNHPTRGLVSPIEFISVAEETGLIIKMSDTIRHIACKQYIEWQAKGVAPPRVAVNISSQDLRRKAFSDDVLATLRQYNVPTSAIELEITESMFVDASGGIVDVLRALQNEGFLIAIDDFGTGYSSLSYLGLLPFDILKVDRSFVLGIGKPEEKIVSVIVDVAHTFEKKVIAEGVDSEHQHRYLSDLGCEIIQGYLFSKPLMPADFEAYARKLG